MLSGKVLKFSITFVVCISPDSASCSVSRVLRDRCQFKSESGLLLLSWWFIWSFGLLSLFDG
jgi:hypothetical protein